MEFNNDVLMWAGSGLLLMLAELIIPGGIVVFLGLAAITVSALLQFGFINNWMEAFTLFFVTSIALLLIFRNVGQNMVGGDSKIENTDENLDVFGQEATVIETIGPGTKKGRIHFQGTDWSALGDGTKIAKGEKAKVICRENISYIVEKIT